MSVPEQQGLGGQTTQLVIAPGGEGQACVIYVNGTGIAVGPPLLQTGGDSTGQGGAAQQEHTVVQIVQEQAVVPAVLGGTVPGAATAACWSPGDEASLAKNPYMGQLHQQDEENPRQVGLSAAERVAMSERENRTVARQGFIEFAETPRGTDSFPRSGAASEHFIKVGGHFPMDSVVDDTV